MQIDPQLRLRLERGFSLVRSQAAAFPEKAAISKILDREDPSGAAMVFSAAKTTVMAKLFTTAAIEMWHRSVHSFLVSVALTSISDVWASSTGYYSSHYVVRGLAHLLGYFQWFSRGKIVKLLFDNGNFECCIDTKNERDHEHRFYWRIVKSYSLFAGNAFFTINAKDSVSDSGHRTFANYADHLARYPEFSPLDADEVKTRIERISEIRFGAPPIPQIDKYPDVESVQVIAYHRLVFFRTLVDEAVGTSNRFWRVHRDPPWARRFMDFQIVESGSVDSELTR